jgi:antitoxin component YwqK of YwqJK toxin-antitoxin module
MKIKNSLLLAGFLMVTSILAEEKYDTTIAGKDRIIHEKIFEEGNLVESTYYLLLPGFSPDLPIEQLKKYRHGIRERFGKNGILKFRSYWDHGKRVGNDTTWHDNGKVYFITTYDDSDRINGTITRFDSVGRIENETSYSHGKLDGKDIEYYPDGKKKREIAYSNGEKQGWCMIWYEGGILRDSTLYENGFRGENFEYYKSGKLRLHSYALNIPKPYNGGTYTDHFALVLDSYDPQGKLVSQVRSGEGFIQDFEEDGTYKGIVTYTISHSKDNPSIIFDNLTTIDKDKLIETKDPRYPPKEIPKSQQLPFDISKYGKLLTK